MRTALIASAALLIVLMSVIVAADPYGLRVGPGRPPTPLMDINQRYVYPQLARSGLFDSAVFGTSTVRLLDPEKLSHALGGRFANLGLNAGTPWEQMQIADLFLRSVPRPRQVVLGLDRTWCEPDADRKRLTFRPFPPWLYDRVSPVDTIHLLDLKTLEIAGRVFLHRFGLMKERIRGDGFEVFTPPETTYDLARARIHIHAAEDRTLALNEDAPADAPSPALDWLAAFLRRLPAGTKAFLVLPPIHVVSQAAPGSRAETRDLACKARIARIGAESGAAIVDYRFPSDLTRNDENYWDKLHYRRAVAGRIVEALREAASGARAGPDWRRL